jgi:hypothetical protein
MIVSEDFTVTICKGWQNLLIFTCSPDPTDFENLAGLLPLPFLDYIVWVYLYTILNMQKL